MKKIFLICSLLISVVGFSQTVVSRASTANTVKDGRVMDSLNQYIPRYRDTTTANLTNPNNIGIDSAGAIIYTYDIKGFWYRQHSPKKWVRVVSDNNLSNNFFFDSTCNCYKIDTTSLINIINNYNADSSITSIQILNDSTVKICFSNGSCINIGIVTNITNISTVYWLGGDSIVVCKIDTAGTVVTQMCDTITIGTHPPTTVYQNGLRQSGNVVEWGDNFNDFQSAGMIRHNTTVDMLYSKIWWENAAIYDYGFQINKYPGFSYAGTGIQGWLHRGGGIMPVNTVRLGINYTDSLYEPLSAGHPYDPIYGYLGANQTAYLLGVNGTGIGSFGWGVDNFYSKTVGLALHTTDTINTSGVTIYAAPQRTATSQSNTSFPIVYGSGLSDYMVADFNTDKTVRFYGYNSTNNIVTDTGRYKPAVFDSVDGKFKKAAHWFGGGGNVNLGRGLVETTNDTIQFSSFPRSNISTASVSSYIPSWVWVKQTETANLTYTDGTLLFYVHDTLFCVGGFGGAPTTTDSIHYSIDLGKTWAGYSIKWPYSLANITSIKARYPGDWNYVFGETGNNGNRRTVIRFKDFQNLQTMTTEAEYGDIFLFGAEQDQYGNIYIFGGQTYQDTLTVTPDVWMSTAQSGGASWTKIQSNVSWMGGCLINQVRERNGYIYVLKGRDKFAGGGGGSAYSKDCYKIAVENIRDKTKWIRLDTIPNVDGLFASTALFKGNIFIGLGSYRGLNDNNMAYLDNDDKWHILNKYIGVDSTNGVIGNTHASDMIVIGESMYTGLGSNSPNFYKLKDTTYFFPHFVQRYLGVGSSTYVSTIINSNEAIFSNGVIGSYVTGDSMTRIISTDAPYQVMSKTNGVWWGILNSGNSTQNSNVEITTGRKIHLDENFRFNIYTNSRQTGAALFTSTSSITLNGDNANIVLYGTDLNLIGYYDGVSGATFGLRYHQPSKSFLPSTNGGFGKTRFWSINASAADLGRTATLPDGSLSSTDALFLANETADSFRIVGYRTSIPTSGTWDRGDQFIYNGTDTTIVAYRCTASGTPGTWKTIRSGNGAGGTTADNGLTMSTSTNVQLFGDVGSPATLLSSRYLTGGDKSLNVTFNSLAGGSGMKLSSTSTAATSSTQKVFEVSLSGANANSFEITYAGYFSNTHTGTAPFNRGVYGEASGSASVGGYFISTSGIGLVGISTGGSYGIEAGATVGSGIYAHSDNGGYGIAAQSTGGIAINGNSVYSNTNAVNTATEIVRGTSGTAADGIGSSIDFKLQADNGSNYLSNQIISKFTTAANATRTSQFVIAGINSGTPVDILTLNGDKSIKANGYGSGTFTGTPTKWAAFTSSGNVIETIAPLQLTATGMDSYVATSGSSSYTVNISDKFIDVDASSATRTINLPDVNSYSAGSTLEYIIKKTDSGGNSVIVDPFSTQTIEGSSTVTLATQYKYIRIYAAGTMWKISGSN